VMVTKVVRPSTFIIFWARILAAPLPKRTSSSSWPGRCSFRCRWPTSWSPPFSRSSS